jgi:hypothetical protein
MICSKRLVPIGLALSLLKGWVGRTKIMTVKSQLKAGKLAANHNEPLRVRSAVRAGKIALNHSEALQVRSSIKAGKIVLNHNEKLQRATDRPAVSMRRKLPTTSRKEDRLELLVVRAGVRAGRRARGRYSR